ncbi:winged helix DNA-binding domain-containing protein [Actinomadura sp. LOL_016]|uniref:winged helix DNA-binding domain-containing protein n=1 Tax=unclassified Actinomadura TaxID=2626254 RepID=UPI003A7F7E5D
MTTTLRTSPADHHAFTRLAQSPPPLGRASLNEIGRPPEPVVAEGGIAFTRGIDSIRRRCHRDRGGPIALPQTCWTVSEPRPKLQAIGIGYHGSPIEVDIDPMVPIGSVRHRPSQRQPPMLVRLQRNASGKATAGIDLDELVAKAHSLLADETLTRPELGRALAEQWPGRDPVVLARSVQFLTTMVHPPPDGTWEWRRKTPFMSADRWLGAPPDKAPESPAQRLVLRYLAAFGPASTRDVQAWSGLTGLRHAIAELRPGLQVFRSEDGRELFDLPDAPRPDLDTEAPVRFLAPLDNVLLAHHDRRRVVDDEQRKHTFLEAAMTVDGFVHGLWRVRHIDSTATLVVRLFKPIPKNAQDSVVTEGMKLLHFAAARAEEHDVRFQGINSPWPPGTPWSCRPQKAARRSRDS